MSVRVSVVYTRVNFYIKKIVEVTFHNWMNDIFFLFSEAIQQFPVRIFSSVPIYQLQFVDFFKYIF